MRQSEITEEEILCAKQSLMNGYRSLSDSAKALETWYLRRIIAGKSEEPEEVLEKIAALTVEDVVRVANTVVCDTVYFLKGEKTIVYDEADCEVEE
jgi:predicted Zn-dependent peptidase